VSESEATNMAATTTATATAASIDDEREVGHEENGHEQGEGQSEQADLVVDSVNADVREEGNDSVEVEASTEVPKLDLSEPHLLMAAIEAILFVSDAPVAAVQLASALDQPEDGVTAALAAIGANLAERGSGLELRAAAGGWRLYTRADLHGCVETFLLEGQQSKLSQAALETLAVVAYRQPVTRSRISAIRGVNVDGVVRTLLNRGLIVEAGTDSETGGGLYRTSELFLERMGLNDLSELPSLAPLLPELDTIEVD